MSRGVRKIMPFNNDVWIPNGPQSGPKTEVPGDSFLVLAASGRQDGPKIPQDGPKTPSGPILGSIL